MKDPHPTQTPPPSISGLDPRLVEVFKDLDHKIENLSNECINHLIDAVQMCIKNNHIRLMGLDLSAFSRTADASELRKTIEHDNHFLAGTVLPKLYEHVDSQ